MVSRRGRLMRIWCEASLIETDALCWGDTALYLGCKARQGVKMTQSTWRFEGCEHRTSSSLRNPDEIEELAT